MGNCRNSKLFVKLKNLRKISSPHGDLEQWGLSDFFGQEKQRWKRTVENHKKNKEAFARRYKIKQYDGDFNTLDPDVHWNFKA